MLTDYCQHVSVYKCVDKCVWCAWGGVDTAYACLNLLYFGNLANNIVNQLNYCT